MHIYDKVMNLLDNKQEVRWLVESAGDYSIYLQVEHEMDGPTNNWLLRLATYQRHTFLISTVVASVFSSAAAVGTIQRLYPHLDLETAQRLPNMTTV